MVQSNGELSLSRYLTKYVQPDATKRDILEVIRMYQALQICFDKFVFNDGSTRDLVQLNGTIPVTYKGNVYHIPVCLWIMDTHPNNAPMCFVKPTPDMHIKVSMYCDHNGKIYLPYLHDWQPSTSDLMGLIQVMIVTFGECPPVYSKPKNATPYPSQPSYMPQPGGAGSYLPYPSPGSAGGAFPPYPTGNNFGAFPGYPPMPTPPNSGGGVGGGYPTPYPPASGGYPPQSGYNTDYNPNSSTVGTGTITEEHIKASLVSAVEDKVRRRIQERVNQCQAEIQTLNRTKQELTEGRAKVNDIIVKLEREEAEIKRNLAVLKEKEQELDKSLEMLEKANGIEVDEAVITTAPLYRQLLNAYAEESATEDAVYYLGEALRRGAIDLDTFLKHVRQLARKQFMLRALMQKCRQKAGLAG